MSAKVISLTQDIERIEDEVNEQYRQESIDVKLRQFAKALESQEERIEKLEKLHAQVSQSEHARRRYVPGVLEHTFNYDFLNDLFTGVRLVALVHDVGHLRFASSSLAQPREEPGELDKNEGTKTKWSNEKEELLRTHRGWFVAYSNDERVALAPTLNHLVKALDEKLGSPRKPCEFHEIIEQPVFHRGPSPRLMGVKHS
jgi:hypothetical protein